MSHMLLYIIEQIENFSLLNSFFTTAECGGPTPNTIVTLTPAEKNAMEQISAMAEAMEEDPNKLKALQEQILPTQINPLLIKTGLGLLYLIAIGLIVEEAWRILSN